MTNLKVKGHTRNDQLKRQFGEPPMNARFKIASTYYDFGTYYEVAVRDPRRIHPDDAGAVLQAFKDWTNECS